MFSRFALRLFNTTLIILVSVAGIACSSSPGVTPTTVDGEYTIERFDFAPDGFGTLVNVRDSLQELSMEVFGEDQEYLLRYQFRDEARSRIRGQYSVDGANATFVVEQGDPARLLLPAGSFPMRVENGGDVLSLQTQREAVDLRPFGIPQSNMSGELNVRMQRN